MAAPSAAAVLALVAILGGSCSTSRHSTPRLAESPAVSAFLGAWQRSLTTSWSLEESVERTTRAGGHAVFAVHVAQRPPDRVEIGSGSVQARLNGRQIGCAAGSNGKLACRATPAPPYSTVVDNQLSTLRSYLVGAHHLYHVRAAGRCFVLTLALPSFLAPPYGTTATFCFDRATGAPDGSVVVRAEGTDRTTVTQLHAPATDADLALPPGAHED